MFLNSSLPPYAVAIIIVVVALQYALALFCLLKLAYLDIPKKQYVLWNLFILLVFFIGAAVFIVYYSKVKDTKKIPPYVEGAEVGEAAQAETADKTTEDGDTENADAKDDQGAEEKDGDTENTDGENSDAEKD